MVKIIHLPADCSHQVLRKGGACGWSDTQEKAAGVHIEQPCSREQSNAGHLHRWPPWENASWRCWQAVQKPLNRGRGLCARQVMFFKGCLFWFLAAAVGPRPSKMSVMMLLISTGAMFSPWCTSSWKTNQAQSNLLNLKKETEDVLIIEKQNTHSPYLWTLRAVRVIINHAAKQ